MKNVIIMTMTTTTRLTTTPLIMPGFTLRLLSLSSLSLTKLGSPGATSEVVKVIVDEMDVDELTGCCVAVGSRVCVVNSVVGVVLVVAVDTVVPKAVNMIVHVRHHVHMLLLFK